MGIVYKYTIRFRVTQPFICWCFSGPKGVHQFVFLDFRRVSGLSALNTVKFWQPSREFTRCLCFLSVRFPLGRLGIQASWDHEGKGPLERACLGPGLLSGILLRYFRLLVGGFSLFLVKASCSGWKLYFTEKQSFKRRNDPAPCFPLLSCLELVSTDYYPCLCGHSRAPQIYWVSTRTLLVGCSSEQNWWDSYPHRFEACHRSYQDSELLLCQPSPPQDFLDTFRQLYLDCFYTTLKRHENN